MPIYEYKCSSCGARLEKMQKLADEPPTICEACGGRLEKQWSRSGFQFKGSGWYVTDYASKKSETASADKTEAKNESGAKSESDAKSDATGETKTEKTSRAESTAKPDGASKPTDTKSSG